MLYVERALALGRKETNKGLNFVKPGDWKEHQDVFRYVSWQSFPVIHLLFLKPKQSFLNIVTPRIFIRNFYLLSKDIRHLPSAFFLIFKGKESMTRHAKTINGFGPKVLAMCGVNLDVSNSRARLSVKIMLFFYLPKSAIWRRNSKFLWHDRDLGFMLPIICSI